MHARLAIFVLFAFMAPACIAQTKTKPFVLKAAGFKHYVDYFNKMEDENIVQAIPNAQSWDWMQQNIPLFECPQQNFEEIFYYRWWTLRKHIKDREGICIHGVPGTKKLCG